MIQYQQAPHPQLRSHNSICELTCCLQQKCHKIITNIFNWSQNWFAFHFRTFRNIREPLFPTVPAFCILLTSALLAEFPKSGLFLQIHFTLHPDTLPWSKFGCFHLLCKLECSWKFNSSAHKLHNIWEPWVSISLNRTGADLPSVTCRVNGVSASSNEKADGKQVTNQRPGRWKSHSLGLLWQNNRKPLMN